MHYYLTEVNQDIDTATPTASGSFTTAVGDVIIGVLTTTNNTSDDLSVTHTQKNLGTLIDDDTAIIAGNGAQLTTTFPTYTQGGSSNSAWEYKTVSSEVVNGTINMSFIEAGVTSEFITITNSTQVDQIFQKASTNTNNGLTSVQFVIGDTYEIEGTFESILAGATKTLEQSGSGAGMNPFTDTTSGAAQTVLGPVVSTFTVVDALSNVQISITQT